MEKQSGFPIEKKVTWVAQFHAHNKKKLVVSIPPETLWSLTCSQNTRFESNIYKQYLK